MERGIIMKKRITVRGLLRKLSVGLASATIGSFFSTAIAGNVGMISEVGWWRTKTNQDSLCLVVTVGLF